MKNLKKFQGKIQLEDQMQIEILITTTPPLNAEIKLTVKNINIKSINTFAYVSSQCKIVYKPVYQLDQ